MKSFSFLKFLAKFLAMFSALILTLAAFSPPPARAAGPVFVSLLPIQSMPVAATVTDSNLFYVVTGYQSTSYKRATAAVMKTYMGIIPYSFTDSITGFSTTVTTAMLCAQSGSIVNCKLGAATGTSNATTKVLQHLPAAITPVTAQLVTLTQITDNGSITYQVKATVGTDGTVTLTLNGSAFTATGTCAITAGTSFAYNLL